MVIFELMVGAYGKKYSEIWFSVIRFGSNDPISYSLCLKSINNQESHLCNKNKGLKAKVMLVVSALLLHKSQLKYI